MFSPEFIAIRGRYGRLGGLRAIALANALLAVVGPAQRCVVTATPLGVRLWLDPLNHLGMSLAQGLFEEPVTRALERYLGPGAVFLDIGANEGVLSVYAACLVGAAGTVLAVEPQSRLQAVIDRNFALNGLRNYRLWACALSDHDDATLALNLYPGLNTGFLQRRCALPLQSVVGARPNEDRIEPHRRERRRSGGSRQG